MRFCLCFVTSPYGVLGQVWHLIVSIPDLCLISHFITVNVLWLFAYGAMDWSAMRDCAIPDHTHLFFSLEKQERDSFLKPQYLGP